MAVKRTSVVGDAQAEAVALALKALQLERELGEIAYEPSGKLKEWLSGDRREDGSFAIIQLSQGSQVPHRQTPSRDREVFFPTLALELLWPFNCVNENNRPEPPKFSQGRFPFGDAVLAAGIKQGVAGDALAGFYLGAKWDDKWPDMQRLLASETSRLSALDKQFELTVGQYIIKNFRTERLFWNVYSPADVLLIELLHEILGKLSMSERPSRAAIRAAVDGLGTRDILGSYAVPIHPAVAKKLELRWYSSTEKYNQFDIVSLGYDDYIRAYIANAKAGI